MALIESAHKLGVGFKKDKLLEAVHLVSASKASDAQAIKTVVDETLNLVNEIRLNGGFGRMPEISNDNIIAEDGAGHAGHYSGNETRSSFSVIVRTFLSSLALLFRTLPDHHHDAWQSLRNSSACSVTVGNAVEDLVHLAVFVWELDNVSNSEPDFPDNLSGNHGEHSPTNDLASGRSVRLPPWEPIIQVVSWGVIPLLEAENSLLSCIQAPANLETCEKGYWGEKTESSRRNILMAVVTSVARRYHSLGVGQDLSTVLLGDLLGVAASLPARQSSESNLFHYHPMNLCRLVARLTVATHEPAAYVGV